MHGCHSWFLTAGEDRFFEILVTFSSHLPPEPQNGCWSSSGRACIPGRKKEKGEHGHTTDDHFRLVGRNWNACPLLLLGSTLWFIYLFFSFIFISWRLITSQYCSGFCHTLTWISHGFTCIPRPDPPSHLPLYPIPLGLPSAPGRSTCLMHPTWAGDLFHPK